MVPFVGEPRADRRIGEDRSHGELDPEHVLEASARLEVAERAEAGTRAQRRRDALVAQAAGDRRRLLGQGGIVERTKPSGDERAGTRGEAVAFVRQVVDSGAARMHRRDRILEARVVVVGDADALHQRRAGEEPPRRDAGGVEARQRPTQLGPSGADVDVGAGEALAQQAPGRIGSRGRSTRHGQRYSDGSPGGRVLKRRWTQRYCAGLRRISLSIQRFMRALSATGSSLGKSVHGGS